MQLSHIGQEFVWPLMYADVKCSYEFLLTYCTKSSSSTYMGYGVELYRICSDSVQLSLIWGFGAIVKNLFGCLLFISMVTHVSLWQCMSVGDLCS